MANNLLLKKLQIKSGNRVAILNAPTSYLQLIDLPSDVNLVTANELRLISSSFSLRLAKNWKEKSQPYSNP
jgi:hypothetical protein